ncbi:MAG: TrmH family RNA methyltransferase [Patescibacteria group bacterium]|nr:TrmH family RNA methyltransferase [Patescibacteria group bacterium]
MEEICVVLHDIRSSENVGSIFRTADAAGVLKIYLTGYTPSPKDRFGRPNARLVKAALGAEISVEWQRAELSILRKTLKEEGKEFVAVEQSARSISYTEWKMKGPTAFVFGNEVDGLSEDVLGFSDSVIEIPMRGEKESLNVAVAAGIILFEYQ